MVVAAKGAVNASTCPRRAFRLLDAVRAEQRLSAWSRTSSPSAAAADFGRNVPICAILRHALSERCPPVAQNVIPVCHGILWIVGESAPRRGSARAGSIYLLASACHEDRVARMYCPVQWPLRIIERPCLPAVPRRRRVARTAEAVSVRSATRLSSRSDGTRRVREAPRSR